MAPMQPAAGAWGFAMLARFWTFAQKRLAAARSLLGAPLRAAPLEPAPLSPAERWTHATGAVVAAITSFERIQDLQAAAADQIDAADYTLQHILEDLAFAIPMAADGSALRALLATVAEREAAEEERVAA